MANGLTVLSGTFAADYLGSHKGPFEIIRAVSRTCGPQVAVEHSGGRAVIVSADTTYQQFLAGPVR